MERSKAPWKLEIATPDEGEVYEDGSPALVWFWLWNADHNGIVCSSADNKPTRQGDFTLIAAAPELLEACKAALFRLKEYDYQAMQKTIEKLEAAIAKAEVK